jgi:hypothetical protein
MRRIVSTSSEQRALVHEPKLTLKNLPRNKRERLVFSSQLALVVVVSCGLVFLLAIHFYLYRAITTRENDVSIPQPTNETEPFTLTPLRDIDLELYTIRINTWKRHEQLVVSIEHHSKCVGVAQIQVVWCEDGEPPPPLLENPKVVVERHTINSLNERFHILEESPTLGILSMDDDVLRPCEAIDSGTTSKCMS